MSKTKAIIIDLDGTLSDCSHRQHFMTGEKKNWNAFYEGLSDDPVNVWCKDIITAFTTSKLDEFLFFHIILVSGRPDKYMEKSVAWLNKNKIEFDYLLMRKTGDFRADYIVKEEIYRNHIEPEFNILFAVDDRKQVVDMWRRIGVTCLQCAEGNF